MSTHPMTEIMSNQIEIEEGEVSIESNTSSQENINENENSNINHANDSEDESNQGFFLKLNKKEQQSQPHKKKEAPPKKRERSRSPKESSYHHKYSSPKNGGHKYNDYNTFKSNNSLGLCKYFLNGKCIKGDKCPYSHKLKDFPCKFYIAKGFCDHKANCKLTRDEMTKFIHDNKQYLLDERQKYGKTKIDRFIDEYLKKEAFFQNKKALEQNILYGGLSSNPADILSINNANNIIMNYHLMNNAIMTGAISLMNYFPVDNTFFNNSQPQNLQPFYQADPTTMNGFPEGEKKEEQKSNDSIELAVPKEEKNTIINDNAPKDPRLKNKN